MGERGATYSLKYQARALAAVKGENKKSRWLVGTNSLREDNEVQLLEFDSDRDAIKQVASYPHEHEVWQIAVSPSDASRFFTVRNQGGAQRATLWRAAEPGKALEAVTELQPSTGAAQSVTWCHQNADAVVSLEEGHIRSWALHDASADEVASAAASELSSFASGCWNPHNRNSFFTTGANNWQAWDLRSMQPSMEVQQAHSAPVRDVDAAHQHQHLLVTSGDDAKVRYWDLRQGAGAKPLFETSTHKHWVWQAVFNPAYDQLVLSCSSDSLVGLVYAPGLINTTGDGLSSRASLSSGAEVTAKTFDDHEESAYGVAWSTADPWVFASLSYDGRVVVNRVPGQIKYKILI